jgi:hypothetical protein
VKRAPFVTLAHRIRSQFKEYTFASEWAQTPELMLWITMMAAVASRGKTSQAWIIVFLALQLKRHPITTWDDFRDRILMNHLWLPMTNDKDGIEIWDQVERIRATAGYSQGAGVGGSTGAQIDGVPDFVGIANDSPNLVGNCGTVVRTRSKTPR